MPELAQFILSGLTVGAVYALVALGFIIIYNASEVVNFAQGEFVMLGGMITVSLCAWGVPLLPAIMLAVAVVSLSGAILYRFIIHPARHASGSALAFLTVGFAFAVEGLTLLAWGWESAV